MPARARGPPTIEVAAPAGAALSSWRREVDDKGRSEKTIRSSQFNPHSLARYADVSGLLDARVLPALTLAQELGFHNMLNMRSREA